MTAVAVKIREALDDFTKLRRDTPPAGFETRISSTPIWYRQLLIAAMFLQHLDFISIGVVDEKELREQSPLALEFLHRFRIEAQRLEVRVFFRDIIDGNGKVAVPVSVRVRLGPAVVYGQLELEVVFRVSQIDESELVELKALSHFQPKSLFIEINGSIFVDDTDHTVQDFGHRELPEFLGFGPGQRCYFSSTSQISIGVVPMFSRPCSSAGSAMKSWFLNSSGWSGLAGLFSPASPPAMTNLAPGAVCCPSGAAPPGLSLSRQARTRSFSITTSYLAARVDGVNLPGSGRTMPNPSSRSGFSSTLMI